MQQAEAKDDLTTLQAEMRACRRCLLAGYEITAGAIFSGNEGARVMVIGQAPGVTEVEAKRPFNASSGRRLFDWLGEAGWDESEFRQQHYMTAVTKCFPGKSKSGKGDRAPSKAEQAYCQPFLHAELALIDPRLIIPVGGLAIRLFFPPRARLAEVIGSVAYYPPGALGDLADQELTPLHFSDRFGAGKPRDGHWLVPLPHPSGASLWPNKPENKILIERALAILREIRAIMNL